MSFSKKIQKSVDDTIQDFIKNISKTYNIDYTEIYNIWSNGYDIKNLNTIETQVQVQNQNITSNSKDDKQKIINNLNKLTKPDLVEMCKNKGLKTKGTKAELIELLSQDELKVNKPSDSIIKKWFASSPPISIKRNKFNNYEHEETSFVFNNKEKKVYGKQNSDGSIEPLTKDDINLCNKYKFDYFIPDNLNKESKDDNDLDEEEEELEDLEEDEDVEEIEEEEELEEEFE